MTTTEIETLFERLSAATPDTEVRTLRRCEIGRVPVHQGDIYIHRVADDHPRGAKIADRQLALGDTMGARHMVEGDTVEVFEGAVGHEKNRALMPCWKDDPRKQDVCTGRLFTTRGPCSIPHPEHARHDLQISEPGTYQVTHQWDEVAMGRVMD